MSIKRFYTKNIVLNTLYAITIYYLPLILQVFFGMKYFQPKPKICQTKIITRKIKGTQYFTI